jgi:multidrug efflux system membrane fusion protein
VRLASGEVFEGVVRFVQFRAEPATRTFRVEVTAPNPEGRIRSGLSAGIRLVGGMLEVARVPTGVLALNDEGRIGVRVLDASDTVQFFAVDVVEDTPEGVWVTGLPEGVRVIVRGQEFVDEGRRARAVSAPQAVAQDERAPA